MRVHRFMGCFPETWMLPRHTSLRHFGACASPMAHRVSAEVGPQGPREVHGSWYCVHTVSPQPLPLPHSVPMARKAYCSLKMLSFPRLLCVSQHYSSTRETLTLTACLMTSDPLSKSSSDTPICAGLGVGGSGSLSSLSSNRTWWDLALTAGVGVTCLYESSPAGQIVAAQQVSGSINE